MQPCPLCNMQFSPASQAHSKGGTTSTWFTGAKFVPKVIEFATLRWIGHGVRGLRKAECLQNFKRKNIKSKSLMSVVPLDFFLFHHFLRHVSHFSFILHLYSTARCLSEHPSRVHPSWRKPSSRIGSPIKFPNLQGRHSLRYSMLPSSPARPHSPPTQPPMQLHCPDNPPLVFFLSGLLLHLRSLLLLLCRQQRRPQHHCPLHSQRRTSSLGRRWSSHHGRHCC